MARYWIGGTGNWSDTAHWSDSDGGASGFSVPTSADDVFFAPASFSADGAIVTLDVAASCLSLNSSTADQYFTITSSVYTLSIYGDLTEHATNSRYNFTGTAFLYSKGTGIYTTSTSAYHIWNRWYIDSVGIAITNATDFTTSASIYLNNGTWNTNDKTIRTGTFASGGGTRTLNLGSSTLYVSQWLCNNPLTLNAGTSTIKVAGGGFYGYSLTYYNVEISDCSYTSWLTGVNTFNNLTIIGSATPNNQIIDISNSITVNNILTITGNNAACRLLLRSNGMGTQQTITVPAANVVASNVDFRDIKFANAIDFSAITGLSGDCGGNSQITFTVSQPQYFKHTSGAVNWSDSSKWFTDISPRTTPGRVPLPQDTAIFDASSFTGTSTLTLDCPRISGLDMSAINQSITVSGYSIEYYGNFILGANLVSYAVSYLYLSGVGNYIIDTKGKNLSYLNITRGNYTAQSNITVNAFNLSAPGINLLMAVFDLNDFNMTLTTDYWQGTAGTFYAGNGIIEFNRLSGLTFYPANAAIYMEGSTIKLNPASGNGDVEIRIVNRTINKLWLTGGHTGNFVVTTGNNTFTEITIDAGKKVQFTAGKIYTIGKIIAIGTNTNKITIGSITNAQHTLALASGNPEVECDYLNLSYSVATPSSKWFAGPHSTDSGNNSGWIFSALSRLYAKANASGVTSVSAKAQFQKFFKTLASGITTVTAKFQFNKLLKAIASGTSLTGAQIQKWRQFVALALGISISEITLLSQSFINAIASGDTSVGCLIDWLQYYTYQLHTQASGTSQVNAAIYQLIEMLADAAGISIAEATLLAYNYPVEIFEAISKVTTIMEARSAITNIINEKSQVTSEFNRTSKVF